MRYVLPPVPKDKETRAKNQARNEEHKHLKDEKKAKKVKKAKKAEALAKRRCEAEKAGLLELESSEASVSETEDRVNSHWLNELMDEKEEDPLVGGGRRPSAGGHRFLGAQRVPPILSLARAETKPPRRVRHPRFPKERRSHRVESLKRPWA